MHSALLIAALIGLATLYHHRCFRHFSHPEAMDSAQLARNLAQGKGFTTDFIRPAGLYLLKKKTGETHLDGAHPDVANAPLYPWLLSLWMRLGGFDFEIRDAANFEEYGPEKQIAGFNQLLLILIVPGVWWLARRLFDTYVAWVAAGLFAGTDLLWRHALSGLSTPLVLVLVTLLAHLLVSFERCSGENARTRHLWLLALAVGVVLGLLGLTRYAFAWLALPVLVCITVWSGTRGFSSGLAVLSGFLLLMGPWCGRNIGWTGMAFGTAGFAVHQETPRFPGDVVERLMNPEDGDSPRDIRQVGPGEYWAKLQARLPDELGTALPGMGGNWITMFFLVGLFLPFRSRALSRLRGFAFASVVALLLIQALGRTRWGLEAKLVSADDLLIALSPIVFVFGAGMLAVLLGRMEGSPAVTRGILTPLLVTFLCLPLLLRLYAGESQRFAYPPYYPPIIQERAHWLEEGELMMSDVPWATAWYGSRRSVWIPAEFATGFLQIEREAPVAAVYLTARTMDRPLVSGLIRGEDVLLGQFVADAVVNEQVPSGFPLRHAFAEGFPFQLFLSDRPRWRTKAATEVDGGSTGSQTE